MLYCFILIFRTTCCNFPLETQTVAVTFVNEFWQLDGENHVNYKKAANRNGDKRFNEVKQLGKFRSARFSLFFFIDELFSFDLSGFMVIEIIVTCATNHIFVLSK